MNASELLQRIATTLRDDVGPAVDGDYQKTQAFMAAVVLQKLGRELAAAESHRAVDAAEVQQLRYDLDAALAGAPVTHRVGNAMQQLSGSANAASLCHLIEALYADRQQLGERQFDSLLRRVRLLLRAQIDRRMEYAK